MVLLSGGEIHFGIRIAPLILSTFLIPICSVKLFQKPSFHTLTKTYIRYCFVRNFFCSLLLYLINFIKYNRQHILRRYRWMMKRLQGSLIEERHQNKIYAEELKHSITVMEKRAQEAEEKIVSGWSCRIFFKNSFTIFTLHEVQCL